MSDITNKVSKHSGCLNNKIKEILNMTKIKDRKTKYLMSMSLLIIYFAIILTLVLNMLHIIEDIGIMFSILSVIAGITLMLISEDVPMIWILCSILVISVIPFIYFYNTINVSIYMVITQIFNFMIGYFFGLLGGYKMKTVRNAYLVNHFKFIK